MSSTPTTHAPENVRPAINISENLNQSPDAHDTSLHAKLRTALQMDPARRRQVLGELLFATITKLQIVHPILIERITGMLLELDALEIVTALEDHIKLTNFVTEAASTITDQPPSDQPPPSVTEIDETVSTTDDANRAARAAHTVANSTVAAGPTGPPKQKSFAQAVAPVKKFVRIAPHDRERLAACNGFAGHAFDVLSPTLRSFDAISPSTPIVVRANEQYGDVAALFVGERGYVRRAIAHAERIVVLEQSGKRPLMLLLGLREGVASYNVADKTTWFALDTTSLPNCALFDDLHPPSLADLVRVVTRTAQPLSRPVGDLHFADVPRNLATQIQSAGGSLLTPLPTILKSDLAEHQCTVKFGGKPTATQIFDVALALQSTFSCGVTMNGFTLRVAMEHPLTADAINAIGKSSTLISDVIADKRGASGPPLRSWSASATNGEGRIVIETGSAPVLTQETVKQIAQKINATPMKGDSLSFLLKMPQKAIDDLFGPQSQLVIVGGAYVLRKVTYSTAFPRTEADDPGDPPTGV